MENLELTDAEKDAKPGDVEDQLMMLRCIITHVGSRKTTARPDDS